MTIFLATVPHTGTNTVEASCKRAGLKVVRKHSIWLTPGKRIQDCQRWPHQMKAITVRHPQDTWRSWWARGNDLWTDKTFLYGHQNLQDWCDEWGGVHIIPIDIPAMRKEGLRRLGAKDHGIRANAHPGNHGDPFHGHRPMPPELVEAIFSLPIYRRFYQYRPEYGPNDPDLRIPVPEGDLSQLLVARASQGDRLAASLPPEDCPLNLR